MTVAPRRAAVALAALILLLPATASAATRVAVPSGGLHSGGCAANAPCALDAALSSASPGDEVVVSGGDYDVETALGVPAGVNLRGADGARPRLLGDLDAAAPTLTAGAGSSVRHLSIRNDGKGTDALELRGGLAEDLVLEAKKGRAATVRRDADAVVLRDSVLTADDSSGRALQVVAGPLLALGTVQLRNLTVEDFGSSSTAIYSSAGVAALSMQNVIARGRGSDLGGTLTSTILVRNSNFRPWLSQGVVVDLGANQSGSPLFADEQNRDFRPRAGSPTIDAGIGDAFSGLTDLLGVVRGAVPDIGAFEFVQSIGGGSSGGGSGGGGNSGGGSSGGGSGSGDSGSGGSSGGRDDGDSGDESGSSGGALPAPTAVPRQGKSLNAEPETGKVTIKVPGASAPATVTEGASVPVGSVVDARDGAIRLISAGDSSGTAQWAVFSGAIFRVTQQKGTPLTDVQVTGFDPRSCAPAGRAVARSASRARRSRLWGRGKGRWRSRGRRGSASVRGTIWMTEDTCKGTRFKVKEGKVLVQDRGTGRSLFLTAGKSYLARSKPRR
jgi:hypothetical protein